MTVIPLDRINRFLLQKQHLTPRAQADKILPIVQDICALHATGAPNPYLSLWTRMERFELNQLDVELYEKRSLVRRLCMRATLHIVPSQRLPVFLQATRQRLERRFQRDMDKALVWSGLCQEGEQVDTLNSLQQRIVSTLARRGTATMAELGEMISELKAQFEYAPGKPYGGSYSIGTRLISGLCVRGVLVRARPRGSWRSNLFEYALLEEWLPDLNLDVIAPKEARAQLVKWYLAAYGPATVEDIAWWSGFTKRETATAIKALSEELVWVEIEHMGGGYCMLRDDHQRLLGGAFRPELCVNLLPSLDPYVMAYRDRRRFLAPDHYDQVFDRSGNAFASVWVNGQVVGIWQETEEGIELLLWDETRQASVAAEAQRLAAFLQRAKNAPSSEGETSITIRRYPAELKARNPFRLTRR
jgi:hypothetical protein